MPILNGTDLVMVESSNLAAVRNVLSTAFPEAVILRKVPSSGSELGLNGCKTVFVIGPHFTGKTIDCLRQTLKPKRIGVAGLVVGENKPSEPSVKKTHTEEIEEFQGAFFLGVPGKTTARDYYFAATHMGQFVDPNRTQSDVNRAVQLAVVRETSWMAATPSI